MKIFTIFAFVFLCNGTAFAETLYLEGDLGTKGSMRYCKYINGGTFTFNANEMCPISVKNDNLGFASQGHLTGEYKDGQTKVCVYNV